MANIHRNTKANLHVGTGFSRAVGCASRGGFGPYCPWVQCSSILWTSSNCPRLFFLENRGNAATESPGIWRWPEIDLPCVTRGVLETAAGVQRVRVGSMVCISPCPSGAHLPGRTSPPQRHLAQQPSWMSRLPLVLADQRSTNLSLCFCVTSQVLSCLCFCALCSCNCELFGGVRSVDGVASSLGYVELWCSDPTMKTFLLHP